MGKLPRINRAVLTSPNAGRSATLSDSEETTGGGILQRARCLRKHPTEAEHRLWFALRLLKPLGLHFRRQVPIGKYVADFACHRAKIVVELDGSQHGLPENLKRDAERTAFLEQRGYRVLRFWNDEVLRGQEDVIDAVLRAAGSPPPVALSRADLPALGEVTK